MHFELLHRDKNSQARAGKLHTDHGEIETPIFMPVGTAGTVKGVHQAEIENEINAQIILGNTYHLFLRPGTEVIEAAGGLHKFINYNRPILTDSGGYQVYSLSGSRKITEEGVKFQSHIDGSYHFFTPERAIDIQRSIGADIIMAFDECTPYPCDYQYAKRSMKMTHRWLDRCFVQMHKTQPQYGYEQALFPIVQGSVYKDLRQESAKYIADTDSLGNAIGGLSDRKSTRLNSSHVRISYAVFCFKKNTFVEPTRGVAVVDPLRHGILCYHGSAQESPIASAQPQLLCAAGPTLTPQRRSSIFVRPR